jgi:hypothetical protein
MAGHLPDFIQLFDRLPAPTTDVGMGRFCALAIPGFPCCSVGKDVAGNPVLLVRAAAESDRSPSPRILEHFSVIHLGNCRIQLPRRGDEDQVLSVIRCTDADRTFQEYFLRSLYPIVAALPENPSRQQVSIAIDRLVDLFRQLTQSPRKTIAGLWAELFVIAHSTDPEALLTAWHAIPEEHFDFLDGIDRIEVKAACSAIRSHHFSLEQLRPPQGTRVLIASILLSPAEGGVSVAGLVDMIRTKLSNPELLIRLDGAIAQMVGQDWRAINAARFGLEQAIQSVRFLDAASVPCVSLPLPAEVTSVHFRVDLMHHPLSFPAHMMEQSQLFRMAIPPDMARGS